MAVSTRCAVVLVFALTVCACGDDSARKIQSPPWAHVAPEQIAEARKYGVPVAFENDLGMCFVLIPPGTFLVGSPEDEGGRDDDETQHEVTITKPYYMQITEVTNAQYRVLVQTHAPKEGLDRPKQPAVVVSWVEATDFADTLSQRDPHRSYRLPTEAEWEHACRAGTFATFWSGSTEDDLDRVGWYWDNMNGRPRDVAQKPANPWGLYDVHGNAWEWCSSKHAPYDAEPPQGPGSAGSAYPRYVFRGGAWNRSASVARAAYRGYAQAEDRGQYYGLRLVSPLPKNPSSPGSQR
jgi:formylglycine-generating enzyme required for sulfatase activity